MKCPECGERSDKVLDTRGRDTNRIHRRRRCLKGHRFSTLEILANDIYQDNDAIKKQVIERLMDFLRLMK